MANDEKFFKFKDGLAEVRDVDGDSKLRYRGSDNLYHYIPTSSNPNAEFVTEHQSIKTINGESMVGSGNVSLATPVAVVEVSGATPTQALSPNTFYKFTTPVTSLTVTLGTPKSGVVNIYAFSFTAGGSSPFALPTGVEWANGFELDLSEGDYCEVSIMDGIATFITHTPTATEETT